MVNGGPFMAKKKTKGMSQQRPIHNDEKDHNPSGAGKGVYPPRENEDTVSRVLRYRYRKKRENIYTRSVGRYVINDAIPWDVVITFLCAVYTIGFGQYTFRSYDLSISNMISKIEALLGAHMLDFFLSELSLTFITISVLSVLSDGSKVIYWEHVVEETLIKPKYFSFKLLTRYSFEAMALSAEALLLKARYPFLLFFLADVVMVGALAFLMISVYFGDEKRRSVLTKKFRKEVYEIREHSETVPAEIFLGHRNKVRGLRDISEKAYATSDFELLRSNLQFYIDNLPFFEVDEIGTFWDYLDNRTDRDYGELLGLADYENWIAFREGETVEEYLRSLTEFQSVLNTSLQVIPELIRELIKRKDLKGDPKLYDDELFEGILTYLFRYCKFRFTVVFGAELLHREKPVLCIMEDDSYFRGENWFFDVEDEKYEKILSDSIDAIRPFRTEQFVEEMRSIRTMIDELCDMVPDKRETIMGLYEVVFAGFLLESLVR